MKVNSFSLLVGLFVAFDDTKVQPAQIPVTDSLPRFVRWGLDNKCFFFDCVIN